MSEIDEAYQRFYDNIGTTELSTFSKTIVKELEKINGPQVESLIDEIKLGKFDDYHKDAYAFPRMELVDRLSVLGLHDLAKKITRDEL